MKKYIGLIAGLMLAAWLISRVEIKLPQAPLPSPQIRVALTGWQDFNNETYHYNVKIPHDWSAVRLEGEPAYPQRVKLINVQPEEQTKPHVGIIITVNPGYKGKLKDFDQLVQLTNDGREGRELTVAGSKALFFDNLGESGEEWAVFLLHDNNVYQFNWTGTHPDVRKQFKDIGLKIMASLEFR